MKFSRSLSKIILLIGVTTFTHCASAYLQFTYTSDSLAFDFASVDGIVVDDGTGSGSGPASFGISFISETDELSSTSPTSFSIKNPAVTSYNPLLVVDSTSGGYVTLNPNGSVSSWELALLLISESATLENEQININSSGGATGCDCDQLVGSFNSLIPNRDSWIVGARIGLHYEGENSANNWTIENISTVSAPPMYMMIFPCLLLIYCRRLRGKSRSMN